MHKLYQFYPHMSAKLVDSISVFLLYEWEMKTEGIAQRKMNGNKFKLEIHIFYVLSNFEMWLYT